jgi:hypothetical protein
MYSGVVQARTEAANPTGFTVKILTIQNLFVYSDKKSNIEDAV